MNQTQNHLKINNQIVLIDEVLIKQFMNVLELTLKQLVDLNHCQLRQNEQNMTSEIKSYFLKLAYETPTAPLNIILIIVNLVAKYLMSHRLIDGNKRFGLMLLINWMYLCGYRFDQEQFAWANLIIDFVKAMSNHLTNKFHLIKSFAIKIAFGAKIDHFVKFNQYDQNQIEHFVSQNCFQFANVLTILKYQ